MIIPVHMFAFHNDRNTIRHVNIPDDEFEKAQTSANGLELVFRYGQNDFQNISGVPSVSVGDVAEYFKGRYWICLSIGWKEITKKEFDALKPPTAGYAYRLGMKEI